MSEKVVIAVDVLGGDFGPQVVLPGIEQALEEDENLEVIACGPKAHSNERCHRAEFSGF